MKQLLDARRSVSVFKVDAKELCQVPSFRGLSKHTAAQRSILAFTIIIHTIQSTSPKARLSPQLSLHFQPAQFIAKQT
jgi:hypothetical protein